MSLSPGDSAVFKPARIGPIANRANTSWLELPASSTTQLTLCLPISVRFCKVSCVELHWDDPILELFSCGAFDAISRQARLRGLQDWAGI